MTRTNPPKKRFTRTKRNGTVLNPGSLPGKWNDTMGYRAMFLASLGLTEKEIAVALNIHQESIYYWKRTKPEFLEALEKGKLEYTHRVENSMVENANGYNHPAIHFSNHPLTGEVIQTHYTKHYPPNVTAGIFYLKNRARDRWQDVHRIEGEVQHRHLLDLTNCSQEQLRVLKTVGLTELPEHGSNVG